MYNIIERYMSMMSIEDVSNLATKKGVNLSNQELEFTYNFIKKNWQDYFKNPKVFDIDRYKNNYTPENFVKIKKIFQEYYQKFNPFL